MLPFYLYYNQQELQQKSRPGRFRKPAQMQK